MSSIALIIGNTDGIGLAVTKKLLSKSWNVVGVSRRHSTINHESYKHYAADVSSLEYTEVLQSVCASVEPFDLCIYCAGIGELLDLSAMSREPEIVNVNLLGMIKTASAVIPDMVKKGQGHFIGLSSVADVLLSAEAPSYHASKAGFSAYLESLALAVRPKGVYVTNVRFGFVDTKMAKGDIKPFMMSVDRAVGHLLRCIAKKPVRYTAPKIVIPLIKFRKVMMRLGLAR
jgi:short-subunit dehydrogenase